MPQDARPEDALIQDAAMRNEGQGLDLATLVASRVLHDIASPFGALWNGVEFARGDVDADSRAHAGRIVEESATRLRARLQFLRMAFGSGGDRAAMVGLIEPRDMLRDYIAGGRVTLDWEPEGREIGRPAARLISVLALLGFEAMPRGGVLRVGVVEQPSDDGPQLNLVVVADGRAPKIDPMAASLLADGVGVDGEPVTSRHAPALFAHRLAAEIGARLSFGEEDDRVIIAATL